MKHNLQGVAASILLVLAVGVLMPSGCAPKKLSNEEAYKRFVGTWVNTEYPGTTFVRSQVTVIRPDYGGQDWLLLDSYLSSKQADGQSNFKVKKTWVDQEGRTYCQIFFRYIKGWDMFGVFLMRVDKAGKVLEFTSRGRINEEETGKYPEEIIEGASSHTVYYRK